MSVSFPHTGSLFPLVFLAWVPLLLVEHNIYRQKYASGKVLIHAYITFVIYNLGTTYWIYFAEGGEIGAIMAYLLNGFLMAVVFLFFHWTKKYVGQKEGYISLFFYWIAFEYFHYHWELSWPWLNVGNTFAIVPEIIQWYSYTGVLGGTLWVLLVNVLLFKVVSNVIFGKEKCKIQSPLIILIAILLVLPAGVSMWSYFSYEEKKNPVEVVVTQPNVDPYNEKFEEGTENKINQLEKVIRLAEKKITDKTAVVLGPETAISGVFDEGEYDQSPLYNYLKKKVELWDGPDLFLGASTYKIFDEKQSRASRPLSFESGFYESYNTSLIIAKNRPPSFVHKSKLVLGVEKVPFSHIFPFLEELSIENGGTSGTLGVEAEPRVLTTKGFSFAPSICYESIYGGMIAEQCRKGAAAIFIITNDGWWGNSPGHKQHASFARLRAVETHRYVVRSANTGISSVINQRGDVIRKTKYWEEDVFRETVHLNQLPTFYVIYGDVLGRTFGFAFFLLLILTAVRYLRTFGKSF